MSFISNLLKADLSDNLYPIDGENLTGKSQSIAKWAFSAQNYGFIYAAKGGLVPTYFFLPIAPQNLSINTIFATNLTPTLYGTVEEHSSNRYFDISIQGTTGIAPEFTYPMTGLAPDTTQPALPGRRYMGQDLPGDSFTIDANVSVINPNIPADMSIGQDISLLTNYTTGFYSDKSGYHAFHNFYRFLMQYKQDIMQTSNAFFADYTFGLIDIPRLTISPLIFFNYKDNLKYRVCIYSFSLVRSIDAPMLYNYNIQMRGYSLEMFDTTDRIDTLLGEVGVVAPGLSSKLQGSVGNLKRIGSSFGL